MPNLGLSTPMLLQNDLLDEFISDVPEVFSIAESELYATTPVFFLSDLIISVLFKFRHL